MKAILYDHYGGPEVLRLGEMDPPLPKKGEVLVRVRAASLNSWDWDMIRGEPKITRLVSGFRRPKIKVLGCDLSGLVESMGAHTSRFKPGDPVYGDVSGCGFGAFGEYVVVKEEALSPKPEGMSFEQAAATPQAAVLALQGLTDVRPLKPGDRVLLNGAGGGVGTFALQMAKFMGAEVTCVDHSLKLPLLKSLGADRVIDYQREDFTAMGERYDLILDVVAERSLSEYRRAMTERGILAVVGGKTSILLGTFLLGRMLAKGSQRMGLVLHEANKNLALIEEFFAKGQALPVIERCYPLHEAAEAFEYFGEGRVQGKLVLRIEEEV